VSENPKTLRIRNPAASLRARQALGRVRGSRLVSNGKLLHNPWMGPSQWLGPPVDGSRFRQSRNRRGFFGLQHWIWRAATRGLDVNEGWGQTPSVRAVMEEAKARHAIHHALASPFRFRYPLGSLVCYSFLLYPRPPVLPFTSCPSLALLFFLLDASL
jgi:hypothetical protein